MYPLNKKSHLTEPDPSESNIDPYPSPSTAVSYCSVFKEFLFISPDAILYTLPEQLKNKNDKK